MARVIDGLHVEEDEVVAAADQRVRHRSSLRMKLGPVVPCRAGYRRGVTDPSCGSFVTVMDRIS